MRPYTTLFLLSSLDGKISTGIGPDMDFDDDLPHLDGVKEGLKQYYDIEETTDLFSLSSGAIQEKLGRNKMALSKIVPITNIVVDNHNLTLAGIGNLISSYEKVIIVTCRKDLKIPCDVIRYDGYDFRPVFKQLYSKFGCNRLTIQTGGTLNTVLLRQGLIDEIRFVIAPIIVGGKDTPTSFDGQSLVTKQGLYDIKSLNLISANVLHCNYLELRYKVNNR